MRRTGEIVFSIIGAALNLIMIVIGVAFLYLKDNAAYMDYLHANWNDSQIATSIDQMNQSGTLWILPGFVGIVLSVMAILLLRRNGSPRLAGWLLILAAVVPCVISVFGYIPAIFFVIAGVMTLVRKTGGRKVQLRR
ncbi:DUF4064 domain-containing protein [Paenibacillus sp. chi10]|uniref:DUF4064 domain-containing protein n=1 Tax=Paenibacillus suaedae TaxID=3077233 RepID=A0AAJ2JZ53_9BACL|nr:MULTISPECIES: DUF4064 domain-containing protein [unclassified Paenibacillus]MDT8978576.1 DUF4064 domain-containing protein [Paenibacillus sp. chi10]GAV12677.1 hypothetical protein PBN151_2610 [Paenibacillus sp. NAIST15-1]